jgi:hypothetical protein
MTDINKALAFARECLKWERPQLHHTGLFVFDPIHDVTLYFDSISDVQTRLETFLSKRFFIQINRGTSSLFQWKVIVGLQNRISGPPGVFDHGHGEDDDMLDAIFAACVAAARLYPNPQ